MGIKDKNHVLLRQWVMLKKISKRPKKSAQQILELLQDEGFDVDLRTVQRDLKQIYEGNIFPLRCDENKPIGWYWDEYASLFDLPGMDSHAALTLQMAETYLERVLPKSCYELLRPKAEEAEKVLTELDIGYFRNWPNKVRTLNRSQPLHPPQIDPSVLEATYDALLRGMQLEIKYRSAGNDRSIPRIINPQGLAVAEPYIYLFASDKDSQQVKSFLIHRIETAIGLNRKSQQIENFDIDTHINSGAIGFKVGGKDKVRLKIKLYENAGEFLLECPLSDDQSVEYCNDGELIIEARVPNTKQLRAWLAGFGDKVEILSPKSLRDDFSEMINKIANRYNN